jgi:hypothetical protein
VFLLDILSRRMSDKAIVSTVYGSLGFVVCQRFTELLKNIDDDKRNVILLLHRTGSPSLEFGEHLT